VTRRELASTNSFTNPAVVVNRTLRIPIRFDGKAAYRKLCLAAGTGHRDEDRSRLDAWRFATNSQDKPEFCPTDNALRNYAEWGLRRTGKARCPNWNWLDYQPSTLNPRLFYPYYSILVSTEAARFAILRPGRTP
jgi:hypothetical protein